MEQNNADMEENATKPTKTAKRVLELVNSHWPLNPMKAAELLGDKKNLKTSSSKYLYHFRRLSKAGLIEMERMGNTYVAWPKDLERMRNIEKKRKLLIAYDI